MENNNDFDLMDVIKDYLSCAKYVCGLLIDYYQVNETLMRARVLETIPKEGFVENIYFRFHGRGCFFKYDGGEIDIDFGPKGRFDGFDLYRIKKFLETNTRFKINQSDNDFIEKQFNMFIRNHVIGKLPGYEDDFLYYVETR
ncbi:hypothetical protein DC498_08160 [Terrimonas sp.]|uniref:DUF6896 domain-containing protein n=1 Tax=Terrimonas sp. TaxID=1914338 RepID=UPI000D50BFFA|nr:hypothetical protein [Terrimonas sp.]PVD52885.1 hypothetical protein DC498_08160 [Terrimonas sp.]